MSMLPAEREISILNLVNQRGTISVRELATRFGVTEVTIRRDLQRMEEDDRLRRTHGGAMSLSAAPQISHPDSSADTADIDALVISPVNNRAAHTLREKAVRNQIPFIAESSPEEGAVYLGCDNHAAGTTLGTWAASYIADRFTVPPVVLDITQQSLHNTRQRSQGFLEGLRAGLNRDIAALSIDGQALYDQSYQIALDALRSQPGTNVIFAINDDSLLAALQAYRDLGYDESRLLALNIGGEGNTIFDALARRGGFQACVALFPELVGRMGIDTIAYLWAGEPIGDAVYTPFRLLTADTLPDYYHKTANGWQLREDALPRLVDPVWLQQPPTSPGKQVSFVIHYRTHEWYQNVSRAMAERTAALGIRLNVQDVKEDLAVEVRNLRRLIGKLAASHIAPGETVIFDTGSTTEYMTLFLSRETPFTLVTNSLAVQSRLADHPNVHLFLTGGEYDTEAHALVGRGAHLLLEEIRADKVFLVAGGLSSAFGVSSVNAREAEVRRHMIRSAKEVIVLADHTVIGMDASIKVCDLERVHTVITDSGIRAEQSLAFTRMGIDVIVAGQVNGRQPYEGGEAPPVND